MLPIHVISLAKEAKRRAEASRQLSEAQVAFEIFDAFDGDRGRELFGTLDDDAFILRTGRHYTPGEVGCFASHKWLWQQCVELDRPILIMEDDFELQPGFAAAVEATAAMIDDLGLIRLQDERRGVSKPIMAVGQFQLERYTKTPHCTLCYAITPKLARRLLEINRDFRAPVDVVMKHVWNFDNPMYCLTPYTVTSHELSHASVIQGREKCDKNLSTRARRLWLKSTWQWQRLVFNWRQSDDWVRRRFAAGRTLSGQP